MKELHARFSKNLVCTVFNITKNSTEYITHENHPEIPCLTALRMSCNLPLIFEEFTYNNSVYIDGGISDNFSIEYANTIGKWILGINFSLVKLKPRSELSIVGYLHQLLGICISNNRNRNKFKNNKIIEIKSLTDLSNLNFNISTKEMLDLFSCGYTQISEGF
jgi:predicted acylesterase/phospholipase RssA